MNINLIKSKCIEELYIDDSNNSYNNLYLLFGTHLPKNRINIISPNNNLYLDFPKEGPWNKPIEKFKVTTGIFNIVNYYCGKTVGDFSFMNFVVIDPVLNGTIEDAYREILKINNFFALSNAPFNQSIYSPSIYKSIDFYRTTKSKASKFRRDESRIIIYNCLSISNIPTTCTELIISHSIFDENEYLNLDNFHNLKVLKIISCGNVNIKGTICKKMVTFDFQNNFGKCEISLPEKISSLRHFTFINNRIYDNTEYINNDRGSIVVNKFNINFHKLPENIVFFKIDNINTLNLNFTKFPSSLRYFILSGTNFKLNESIVIPIFDTYEPVVFYIK